MRTANHRWVAWLLATRLLPVLFVLACDSRDSASSDGPSGADSRPRDADPARARATETVLDEVVKPDTLDHDVVVRASAEPLPAGAEVRSFPTGEYGEPAVFETSEPSYLYFIDDAPYSLYGHPVRYALVAADTAEILKVVEQDFWPLVGGEYPFAKASEEAIVFARVRSGHPAASDGGVAASASRLEHAVRRRAREPDPPCPPGHERTCYSIVVSGGGAELADNLEQDREDWARALRSPGGGCRTVMREVSGVTDPAGAAMQFTAALEEVAALAECCDRVTIVIAAHGQRYKEVTLMDGGAGSSVWREGSPVSPGDSFLWLVWLGDNFLRADTLRGYIDEMWSCHISIVNGSCYSGGFVETLMGHRNLETVIASTGADETRETNASHGTTYLQALLSAYEEAQAAAPSDLPDRVLERSVGRATAADPFVQGVASASGGKHTDHPQLYVRPADAVCPCCGDGKKETPEECDDGNLKPGDGCGSYCMREMDAGMAPVDAGSDAAARDAGTPDAAAPTDAGSDAGACRLESEGCDIVPDGEGGYRGNCCGGKKCAAGCLGTASCGDPGACCPGECCEPYAVGVCVANCMPEDCAMTSCYGCY